MSPIHDCYIVYKIASSKFKVYTVRITPTNPSSVYYITVVGKTVTIIVYVMHRALYYIMCLYSMIVTPQVSNNMAIIALY